MIRLGVTDDELSGAQAAQILSDVSSKCGKKSLSLKKYNEYRKAHPEDNVPAPSMIQKVLNATTWNEAKINAGLATTPWLGH